MNMNCKESDSPKPFQSLSSQEKRERIKAMDAEADALFEERLKRRDQGVGVPAREWVRLVVALIREEDRDCPEGEMEKRERPLWVRRAERLFARQHGRGHLAKRESSLPARIGRLLGNRYGAEMRMAEECRDGVPDHISKILEDGLAALDFDLGPGAAGAVLEEFHRLASCMGGREATLVAASFVIASSGLLGDFCDFASAFAEVAERYRLDGEDAAEGGFQRGYILAVLMNESPEIENQRPVPVLCEFIRRRLPPRMGELIASQEHVGAAFVENVRGTCRSIGLSTGNRGRKRKSGKSG
jgi:hypothetical protein